jgi:hypothetical protein
MRDKIFAIRERTALLLQEHGTDIEARDKIVPVLMQEFGVSGQSACRFISNRKRVITEREPREVV